ncbi:TPA: hypothetical protein P5S63_005012 [Salmonella enterica subsp. enterica serovar Concord]|nr:hypothetical protein [Salmonella enterica subsp. enterica serovar Concord]HDP0196712.1 hypothetical protein [Salmonella enterica subsp. enterica serovar Concord]HDP0376160.1 hypothetical protein [Salmonella enterica subsp. enterica serovar Concord]HDP0377100.1 hypothetical protein [Salmonella enterica subsp. enterica serovar Concord]
MHKLFSLPDALCEFIRALPAPDLPEAHQPETWPEDNTTSNGQTLADMCAPSATWLAARDAYISHVMTCPHCVTHGPKIPRHCPAGAELRRQYDATPFDDHAQNQPDNKIK